MVNIGRNIKLTPRLERKIIEYAKVGNFAKTICQVVGIDESTYYRWMQRAKAGEEPFFSFASRLERAKCVAEIALVMKIRKAAKDPKYWKAATFLLERTRPVNFAIKHISIKNLKSKN